MSAQQPEGLVVLDDSRRLRVLDGAVLDRRPDARLQELVAQAAEVSGFPIALVSLVTRQVQFFRAQVGLPPDLQVARATDRDKSFCQFVVAHNRPLVVEDSWREPWLPRDLIERYGIRAYVGFPVSVLGQTVGSLCVIDVQPRRLGEVALEQLRGLAQAVSARLEELARTWALVPGAEEDQAHQAWLAVAEAQSLASLGEQFARGRLSLEELQRALGALCTLSGRPG